MMPAPQAAPLLRRDGKPDRRPLRAERTIQRILAAARAFADENNFRPRADQIAKRARVSTRSVFLHFDDLDSLRIASLTDEHVRVICARLAMLPARERVRALVSGHLPKAPQ